MTKRLKYLRTTEIFPSILKGENTKLETDVLECISFILATHKAVAYVRANQVKSNRVLQKHYTIYFRMTRHGEHPSLEHYLLSNFQCQEKKIGITEDVSGTAIHRQLLRRFAKFMQLFNVTVPQSTAWKADDQSIH